MSRWVETLPSGRHRVRERLGKTTTTIGIFSTPEAAAVAAGSGPVTLLAIADEWLDRRELAGVRDVATERSRWRTWIEQDPIADMPLRSIRRSHVLEWLERAQKRGRARSTLKNTLNLLRAAFADALDRDLLEANPARDVRVKRTYGDSTKEELMILWPEEQIRLLDSVPTSERHVVAFALFTGMRQGEQWALELADLDLEHRQVVIRFGSQGRSPKSRKVKRVPLFGQALEAARIARESAEPRQRLAFPTVDQGVRRQKGAPDHWHAWTADADLRGFTWKQLRHTCATSLLAGWWGRKWDVYEVRQQLRHSSVKVTERYLRWIEENLTTAGRETPGLLHGSPHESGASFRTRTGDLRFTKTYATASEFERLAWRALHARNAVAVEVLDRLLRGKRLAETGDTAVRGELLANLEALTHLTGGLC